MCVVCCVFVRWLVDGCLLSVVRGLLLCAACCCCLVVDCCSVFDVRCSLCGVCC